jgi:hypothetical protein
MAKKIKYTMTTKEAAIMAYDLVFDTPIPGLTKKRCEIDRANIEADESEGVSGLKTFDYSLAFAIGVTLYVDFKMPGHHDPEPMHPKVYFSYSGTTHDIASASAINDLQRKVVALGATIDAVLRRYTIKPAGLSWEEERLERDKFAARKRYRAHILREVGYDIPIKLVDSNDIGFMLKEAGVAPGKEIYLCGASTASGSPVPCKNKAKHAVWLGRAWGARCGRHTKVVDDKADPIVDILEDYKKDYGKKFLMSSDEADAAREEMGIR